MKVEEGSVLGGRYEIIEKIGSGGMAVVYRARDRKLERYVTVKVLREEFTGDEEFIARFRSEACSAAKLSHPNIVRVYDVGEEDNVNYIVMEYIHGDTLKKAIKEKAPFDSRSTINVAIQMASALSQAHKCHIIHRDIKPQNILVGADGIIKVTDFGIARAATATTMTTTANAAGSVHYFSPEQARGGYVDEKSDIYSLGITMFEMITGVLPYQGNNSVSIALKHINEELPDIRQYNPNCSVALERIIRKATMKKSDERYANVDEMLDDLLRARMELGEKSTKKNLEKDMVTEISTGGVRMSRRKAAIAAAAVASEAKKQEEVAHAKPRTETPYAQKVNEVPQPEMTRIRPLEEEQKTAEHPAEKEKTRMAEDRPELDYLKQNQKPNLEEAIPESLVGFEKYGKKLKFEQSEDTNQNHMQKGKKKQKVEKTPAEKKEERKVILAAVATGLAIVVLFSVIGLKLVGGLNTSIFFQSEENSLEMPYLLGMTLEEAEAEAEKNGFSIENEGTETSKYYDEGEICYQGVAEGESITKGSVIAVKVSSGLVTDTMPNLVGMDENETVNDIIERIGVSPTIEHIYSDSVKAGEVMEQTPDEGTTIDANSTVYIKVSKGSENATVTVPSVVGETESSARSSLEALGLRVGNVSYTESTTVAEGQVITQTLAANTTVAEGSVVNLVVSSGAPEVEEPETQQPDIPGTTTETPTTNTPSTGTKSFTVDMPSGTAPTDSLHVLIQKLDANGRETVMDEFHYGSEFPLSVSVTGTGEGSVTCTVDGVQQWSLAVNFGE